MGLDITEIRVKLTSDARNKLKAYCSVTFEDSFVVRDLKIIDGVKGPFVAMPSRKIADRCAGCGHKNNLRAGFCNQCGGKLDPDRADRDVRGRARLHADLAHPINKQCRVQLHEAIIAAYSAELEQSRLDGYQPKSFDDFEGDFELEDYVDDMLHRKPDRTHDPARAGDAPAEPPAGELEA